MGTTCDMSLCSRWTKCGDPPPAPSLEGRGGRRLALLVAGTATFALAGTAAFAFADGLAPPHAAHEKLHASLWGGDVPAWAMLPDLDGDAQTLPRAVVCVVLHEDASPDEFAADLAVHPGGQVRRRLQSLHALLVEVRANRISDLAALPAVRWIEPPLPRLSETNDDSRVRTGADVVQAAPYGLSGAGVSVLVFDGGTAAASHPDFGGRLRARDQSGTRTHASAVAGTIGGGGTSSGGRYRGLAPGVLLESFGFQDDDWAPGFLFSDPGDLEADYAAAINTYGCVIANNSIGSNVEANFYDCAWQGDYGVTSALLDAIVRGSLGAPLTVVWSAGNERIGERCDVEGFGDFYSLPPPACAKNPIVVGAVNSDTDSITATSSFGPTDDGRIKPDIVAPGCQTTDDFGVTSCNSGTGYVTNCSSSMAAATVTGLAALLVEDWRAHYPANGDPSNAMIKGLLIHTAADLVAEDDPRGPDYRYGYGSVRVLPAVELLRSGRIVESAVDSEDLHGVDVRVPPGTPTLKVTLVWDDVPASPDAARTLVNDLDLRVIGADEAVHYPWTLDPAAPAAPAIRTQPDRVNNVEQVVIDGPAPGLYRVEVLGSDVPAGPQAFILCSSAPFLHCSTAGTLVLDRPLYACDGLLVAWVTDCDLNADPNVAETTTVVVTSDSEPSGENVVLFETSADGGAFRGELALDGTDAAGVLHVAPGDTITATYVDADDGAGRFDVAVTATAAVDCAAPVIHAVTILDAGPTSATIAFQTDEPARPTILYGTDCSDLDRDHTGPDLDTTHAVAIGGLEPDTAYAFAVVASDAAGNETADDNGGACHTLATAPAAAGLAEGFDGDLDLVGWAVLFTPDAADSSYTACTEPIAAWPTDPYPDPNAGTWNRLALTEDDFAALAPSASVSLYGVPYEALFVGGNGYITFTAGDNGHRSTFAAHFDQPRVSAFFTDLSPQRGTVSWRETSDRVAITWDNIPAYNQAGGNSFQVELFFDGRIRIAWLTLAAGSGLVGLSAGDGIPPGFAETDLSGLVPCGPRPPAADDLDVLAPDYRDLTITLSARDDGAPDPPGGLVYVIDTLPEYELRDAATFHRITPAELPYTLPDGGNAVVYRRFNPYRGRDAFTYHADDGGTAPTGGASRTAAVTITLLEPQRLYGFQLDEDPNWAREGAWQFGVPLGGGSFGGDPAAGFTGEFVFGYNLAGDYANNLAAQFLTAGPLDFRVCQRVELRFRRWLGVEGAAFDRATVEASADGAAWTTVWTNPAVTLSETVWSAQVLDLTSVVAGRAAAYVRWGMGPTDALGTWPGWNLDDVEFWGVHVHARGDLDCSGQVDFFDIDAFLAALSGEARYYGRHPDCTHWLADLNNDGRVDFFDIDGFLDRLGG